MKLSLALVVVTAASVSARTNFIIVQPDDMAFYEDWEPPAHLPTDGAYPGENYPAGSNLPWINKLRSNGMTMTSAYATSPKCGTSRYSTVTGRYASRSAVARRSSVRDGSFPVEVSIPRAKLEDWDAGSVARANQALQDGADCSHSNIAQAFSKNGYVTGMVGKWHLTDSGGKNVEQVKSEVMGCGFEKVSAMYPDNIQGQDWTNDHGGIAHNMEYVAHRAVQFIENHTTDDWLLYVNPTVPHGPDILPAMDVDCRITPDGDFTSNAEGWSVPGMTAPFDPPVPGLSSNFNNDCMAYRQTVKDRAASSNNADLGSIWVDDAIGALYNALERTGQLDDTVILFQLDHGKVEKDKIWEGGVRIPQFIHWPSGHLPHRFTGLVSNIDIGPTFLEISGITNNPVADTLYPMDGKSWLTAIHGGSAEAAWSDRCLFFENNQDRAVRCGCDKYLLLTPGSVEFDRAMTSGWNGWPNAPPLSGPVEALADLCDNTGSYITADPLKLGPEADNVLLNEPAKVASLTTIMQCHLIKTDARTSNVDMPDYLTECTGSVATPSPTVTSQPTLPVAQLDGIPRITDYFPGTNEFDPHMKDSVVLKARVLDNDIRRVSFQLHFPEGGSTNFARGVNVGCSGDSCDFELPVDTTAQVGKYGMRIRVMDDSGNEFDYPFDGTTIDFVVADNAAEILDGARTEIREIINRAFNPDPLLDVNLAAKFVRQIFHDCVGGCDGCVDLLNPDNEGLEPPIAALEPVVAMFANPGSHGVTRADIWVLAGLEGAGGQQPNGPDDSPRAFTMDWYGRPTCDDLPPDQCVGNECNLRRGPHRELPSPNLNTHELLVYFGNEFGFNARDTVAIMGAHTLGGLRRENSGYNGINGWLGNTRQFGNGYYSDLIGGTNSSSPEEELMRASNWQQVFVDNSELNTPNRYEWERGVNPDHFVMINADMAIVRDFNGFMDHSGPASGQVTCEFRARRNACPKAAQTFDIAVEYKFDNDAFLEDFEDAYKRMLNTGFVASECPELQLCRVPVTTRERKLLRGILGN